MHWPALHPTVSVQPPSLRLDTVVCRTDCIRYHKAVFFVVEEREYRNMELQIEQESICILPDQNC
jgi:hypothetical protein